MSRFGPRNYELPGAQPILGVGASRPDPAAKVRPYQLLVRFPDNKPMRVQLSAESPKRAALYAQNRWPMASSVEVVKFR